MFIEINKKLKGVDLDKKEITGNLFLKIDDETDITLITLDLNSDSISYQLKFNMDRSRVYCGSIEICKKDLEDENNNLSIKESVDIRNIQRIIKGIVLVYQRIINNFNFCIKSYENNNNNKFIVGISFIDNLSFSIECQDVKNTFIIDKCASFIDALTLLSDI